MSSLNTFFFSFEQKLIQYKLFVLLLGIYQTINFMKLTERKNSNKMALGWFSDMSFCCVLLKVSVVQILCCTEIIAILALFYFRKPTQNPKY
jgi:hypothetical protein